MTSPETQLRMRLESMDRMLAGYKELIAKLESDLQMAQPLVQLGMDTTPVIAEQLARVKEENITLQQENTKLMKRRDELELLLEKRDVASVAASNEKILHFTQNPFAVSQKKYQDEIVRLQAEVNKLKRKVHQLQEGATDITQNISMAASQELLTLREQVKSGELKMERLKDVFRSSSQEFREVCYMLLGYKIDRVANNHYRVTNMYAEDENEYLNFQTTTDGHLNMMESPYSATLDELIALHLQHYQSIPVFLSALTMDLFKRTTIMNTSSMTTS